MKHSSKVATTAKVASAKGHETPSSVTKASSSREAPSGASLADDAFAAQHTHKESHHVLGARNNPGPKTRGRAKPSASGGKTSASNKPKRKRPLTKPERLAVAHARRDAKMQLQIADLLSDENSRDRFSFLDTPAQHTRTAALYSCAVSKLVRRKVYCYADGTSLQPIRLLLAYCAVLAITPELFIKAQLGVLGGFFAAKRIVPKLGMMVSDKALDRIEKYLGMMERSWEKKSELVKALDRADNERSSVWQALVLSSGVMQQRLERLRTAHGGAALTDAEIAEELELMLRAGLVSNIYVALHRLSLLAGKEYLNAARLETLQKLDKEGIDAFYLSSLKGSFREHLLRTCSDRTVIDWLL